MPSASVPPPAAEVLTLDTSRDPDLGLKVLAWLTVAFSLLQIVAFSFGRDQSAYALIGDGILRGALPYRDLWDSRPPGIFFVYALSLAVFGKSMMAPRLVEAICLFALVLGMRRLGGTLFGSRTAGLLGGALAALLHAQLEFWHTGQPETFGAALTVAVLALLTTPRPLRRAWLAELLGGVLLGMIFLLEPSLVGIGLPLAVYLAFVRRREGRPSGAQLSPALFLVAGSLLPTSAAALWFALRGAWGDLSWTLFEFAPGSTKWSSSELSPLRLLFSPLFDVTFGLSVLVGVGLVLGLSSHARSREHRPALYLLLGLLLVQLVGVAARGEFLPSHYAASLPLVALLGGDGFYRLWRRYAVGSLVGQLAFVLLLVALGLLRSPADELPRNFWARSVKRLDYLLGAGRTISREELDRDLYRTADFSLDVDRRVAAELTRVLPAGAPIYVWGFEPAIHWISELPPASRFLSPAPQQTRSPSSHVARELLLADLKRNPPRAVVVHHEEPFPELDRWLHASYELGSRVDDFELYFPHAEPAGPTAP